MKNSVAENITSTIGSWRFLIGQSVILTAYVAYNLLSSNPFDPFPFIFLNLILSFQAAYTAPIILMSHALMTQRDRELARRDHANTVKILYHIEKLGIQLTKEVDDAVDEITEAIEDIEDDSGVQS